MATIVLNGKKIGYEARPEQFEADKPAVVFVHGSGGDREDWRAQLDYLSKSVTVIALELPGHGESDPPGEKSVAVYADWVKQFVEALRLKKVVLAGCSLGSAIVLWTALRNPADWLIAIGLVGSGARLKVHPDFLEGLLRNGHKALTNLSDYSVSRSASHEFKDVINKKFADNDPLVVHGDLSACDDFDVMDEIEKIDLPAVIIVGKDDRLTPVKYSRHLSEKISRSRVVVIPGAGHLVMMEKPDEFNEALRSFLADISERLERE
jgi:pimeloyl-ACP methyl ester carboxylesterase